MFGGGLAPFVTASLLAETRSSWSVAGYINLLAVVSITSIVLLRHQAITRQGNDVMTVRLRRLAFVALVIVIGAGSLAYPPAIADTGVADAYVDQLAEGRKRPRWAGLTARMDSSARQRKSRWTTTGHTMSRLS